MFEEKNTSVSRNFADDDTDITSKKSNCSVDDENVLFTPSNCGVNRFMDKNGLLGSARREKFSSTPGGHDKPAELFRKDLISAMKLADSEHLEEKEYLMLQDPWRQEWEKGVQVPVALDSIPDLSVRLVAENEKLHGPYGFKLPKKYLHAVKDENYRVGLHELHESHKLAEDICRYDLDDFDVTWLNLMNEEREGMGEEPIQEWVMEKVMESLETQCYNNMQNMIKTVEGLGIEYDEDVVCDVCRSPEGEDNNEMVFCDSCDLCVHQACYGIIKIPEGSWLCRTCATGVQPKCILCPKIGGAMKSTKSGSKWAHVSCALWIPEVNFSNPEKMEPITNISHIPASRWALVCSICREKTGACVQCAVKSCKTAFHVTCGFQANLDMKTLFNEDSDQVQLKGYCMKHTKRRDGDGSTPKKTDTPKKESEMTEEEKTEARSAKLAKLAEEFYTCVTTDEVATLLNLEKTLVEFICPYWILKRKANFNKPLMTPKTEEAELLSKQREDSLIARMKMFIHLRQDLERVRNLCYMVSKREKISKQLARMKEEVFYKQVEVLDQDSISNDIPKQELTSIIQAHKLQNSVYDEHDKIFDLSKVAEKIASAECKNDEEISRVPKARIKLESRRQKPETSLKKFPSLDKERGSCSELDVISLPRGDNETNLKDVRSNVKEEVLETVTSSVLPKTSTETNLKVKDQNKLTSNTEKTAKKDRLTRKGKCFSEKEKNQKSEHVFHKSQLIVPAEVRDKVNNAFKISRERKAKVNGLCYHAQTKIDKYLLHQKENHLISPKSSHNLSCYNVNDSVSSDFRETRSVRRKLESDMESDGNDSLYEKVDGEVSIRSSRDTTPDRGLQSLSPRKRGVDMSRLATEHLLDKKYRKSNRLDSETESGQEADSESETANESKFRRSARRRNRRLEQMDDDSSQSTISSTSKSGTRSKIAENWSATFAS